MGVQSPHPLHPLIPVTPAQVLTVLLEAPSSAPARLSGILHLQLPRKERGPGLAAQPGGVGLEGLPLILLLSCGVLQGSEQLIMNLIKRKQEPQSDLGFSLGHHFAQMEGVGFQACPFC